MADDTTAVPVRTSGAGQAARDTGPDVEAAKSALLDLAGVLVRWAGSAAARR